jgi:hypothetical protein
MPALFLLPPSPSLLLYTPLFFLYIAALYMPLQRAAMRLPRSA